MSRATKHSHWWYPISWDPESPRPWQPVLWACGEQWYCLETRSRSLKGRGKNRALAEPQPQGAVPTKGMWGVIKDKPPEGA